MRDRRWDFLYDRQRQPVKAYVLERFAEELRARWSAGAAERPREDVLRFALELARLDLLREFEEVERRLAADAHRLQTPAEEAALHLLVRLLPERCLGL